MSKILTRIEDTVSSALADLEEVDSKLIRQYILDMSPLLCKTYNAGVGISEESITQITRNLEARFDISMELGTLFSASEYRPWLDDAKGDFDWYFWSRYRRLLTKEKYPPQVIRSLDSITDQILDHLEDPSKEGSWSRKGMVVGHVQSGKTANYIGLVNKAADSGYRVIIILAGVLNSLRNQTQGRLDNGFIGRCTTLKQFVGVGLFCWERIPAYFTTSTADFKKSVANQIGVEIGDLKEPVVLVIKKNKSTLENLIEWLKNNNRHNLKDYPMLLIYDEADHASINTSQSGEEATTINRKIRELRRLFEKSSYLGYTATPFANVFIDPETEHEMYGDDLFPRDFIICLDPPTNYVGPDRIFSSDGDLDIVREVSDYEDTIPIKHKKELQPEDIPESLKEAVCCFILSRATRLLRGQKNSNNSMMINISRFTAVQSHLKLLVSEYVKELQQAIVGYYKLNENEALKNYRMASLKNIWLKEFSTAGHSWSEIQIILKDAVSPIGVIEVNSSASAEMLDYSQLNYPNGRNVIAIGGLSLSRGLTLEGLTVSYFLRNSVMYDTLMQMGRWFGYRDKYEDLCRIYMTSEAISWYRHISDVINELREEFKRMKKAGMSPRDFGLCVRSHPESLIVTARNKMRTGTPVFREVSLEGRLIETSVLLRSDDIIKHNLQVLQTMVLSAKQDGHETGTSNGYLWENVSVEYVKQFIKSFLNHPASQLTEKNPVGEYIKLLESQGTRDWDVILVSLTKDNKTTIKTDTGGYSVITQERKAIEYAGNGIAINKRRVASRGLEKAGLSEEKIEGVKNQYSIKNIPDHAYRSVRTKPLLMLHLLDCKKNEIEPVLTSEIAAWGISFPGTAGSRKPEGLVKYIVNTTWWDKEYSDLLEEEEEIDNE